MACGTKNDFNHESLRTGRRQPPHDLQLALQREDRIRANRRWFGAYFRRHSVARRQQQRTSRRAGDVAGRRQTSLMARAYSVEELLARSPMDELPELRLLFHQLN